MCSKKKIICFTKFSNLVKLDLLEVFLCQCQMLNKNLGKIHFCLLFIYFIYLFVFGGNGSCVSKSELILRAKQHEFCPIYPHATIVFSKVFVHWNKRFKALKFCLWGLSGFINFTIL